MSPCSLWRHNTQSQLVSWVFCWVKSMPSQRSPETWASFCLEYFRKLGSWGETSVWASTYYHKRISCCLTFPLFSYYFLLSYRFSVSFSCKSPVEGKRKWLKMALSTWYRKNDGINEWNSPLEELIWGRV